MKSYNYTIKFVLNYVTEFFPCFIQLAGNKYKNNLTMILKKKTVIFKYKQFRTQVETETFKINKFYEI